jgi:hypothetical protein
MATLVQSEVRFRKDVERSESGWILAACAFISVSMHVAMLSLGTARWEGEERASSRSDYVIRATVLPAVDSLVHQPLEPSERLAPMKPRTWTPPKLIPMSKADWDSKFDEAQFHAAGELETRPQPLSPIAVPYPKDAQQGGAWSALLAIFIDEDGTVVRVNVLSAKLPLPFEDAAVTTFGSARFRPGRIGDKPVKSRMVIEVFFENAPEIARDAQLTATPVSIEKSAAKP